MIDNQEKNPLNAINKQEKQIKKSRIKRTTNKKTDKWKKSRNIMLLRDSLNDI